MKAFSTRYIYLIWLIIDVISIFEVGYLKMYNVLMYMNYILRNICKNRSRMFKILFKKKYQLIMMLQTEYITTFADRALVTNRITSAFDPFMLFKHSCSVYGFITRFVFLTFQMLLTQRCFFPKFYTK